jgi:hypothetical protein
MSLNEPVFAIVDPADRRVLGDGDGLAIYSSLEAAKTELIWVRDLNRCPKAKIVRVRITHRRD